MQTRIQNIQNNKQISRMQIKSKTANDIIQNLKSKTADEVIEHYINVSNCNKQKNNHNSKMFAAQKYLVAPI